MRVSTLLLGVLLSLASPADGASVDEKLPAPKTAERQVLAELVRAADVKTVPESPGWAAYLKDLALTATLSLSNLLEGFDPEVSSLITWGTAIGARVLFVTTLAILAYLLARWLLYRWRHRGPAALTVHELAAPADDLDAIRPQDEWAERCERHLAADETASACQALWWWLARSLLAADRVEPAWTSRELLLQSNRRDLSPNVRRLDRFIYGSQKPSSEDVRGLWGELRKALR
jgi:hypothetical protein